MTLEVQETGASRIAMGCPRTTEGMEAVHTWVYPECGEKLVE